MGLVGVAHADGVTIRFKAGWNLAGGPEGTIFHSSGNIYTYGARDTDYETSSGGSPITGGKGYWVYFPADTGVTLNGPGVSTMQIPLPAG